MKDFKKTKTLPTAKKKPTARLDVEAVVETIGEQLTCRTPVLEELSGPVSSTTLQRWLPRLSRLRSLAPWDGSSLTGTGTYLASHCPAFESLGFYSWISSEADAAFADFLLDLRSNSLKLLEIYSRASVNAKTFTALNRHSESLTELKLGALEPEAVPSLALLKDCTRLTTLSFSEVYRGTVDLEEDFPDVRVELTSWLVACKSLKSLTVTKFRSSPSLLAPVLQNTDIHLDHLEVFGYPLERSNNFHSALGSQPSLKTLTLRGDAPELLIGDDAYKNLANALTHLRELTYLDLRGSSDAFRDTDIINIAKTHPKLETWWTGGIYITDKVLKPIAALKQLKRLECSASTRFSKDGLQQFFETLEVPGNEGFNFAVNAPDDSEEFDLSPEDEDYIRSLANSSVKGNIEFPGKLHNPSKIRVFHC